MLWHLSKIKEPFIFKQTNRKKKKKMMKVLCTDMGNLGIEVKMKIQKMGYCRTGA